MADSIYSDGRVEKSIDTSSDMFDDVFGEEEEKKKARQIMGAKAEELAKKNKTP